MSNGFHLSQSQSKLPSDGIDHTREREREFDRSCIGSIKSKNIKGIINDSEAFHLVRILV